MRGWYGMTCWEGLSTEQQDRLIHWGNLPWGYTPAGSCTNGAEVEVTTMWDISLGPRMYCRQCAIKFLTSLVSHTDDDAVG